MTPPMFQRKIHAQHLQSLEDRTNQHWKELMELLPDIDKRLEFTLQTYSFEQYFKEGLEFDYVRQRARVSLMSVAMFMGEQYLDEEFQRSPYALLSAAFELVLHHDQWVDDGEVNPIECMAQMLTSYGYIEYCHLSPDEEDYDRNAHEKFCMDILDRIALPEAVRSYMLEVIEQELAMAECATSQATLH